MFLKSNIFLLFLIMSHKFNFCSPQYEISINSKEYGIDKYSQTDTIPIGKLIKSDLRTNIFDLVL